MTADATKPKRSRRATSPVTVKPEGQYHHGDLRRSLIDCGTRLLDTDGIDAMSLRAAAKMAGVSSAAPAHHFHDKNGLLAAIAAQGFRDLRARNVDHPTPTDRPEAKLRALARGYVGFAVAHPERFHLMFGPQILRRGDYPELVEESGASYATLRAVVAPLVGVDAAQALTIDDFIFCVWATLHGLAVLAGQQRSGPKPAAERSLDEMCELFARYVLATVRGLCAPGPPP
jgi:AcrR family transcriptional regulator